MTTFSIDSIKRQASSFAHEKYNGVKIFLTDVTQAELLTEEATNNEPCSPDAKTMTRIAEALYDVDDYWRIIDVLHRRLYKVDWNYWRQSYKSLVLLDFLLTHGPEEFAGEFNRDIDVIQDLGSFKHKDEKGIDWGLTMQKRSDRILHLLQGGETLIQERLKALKITNEIKAFGNLMISPLSCPSSCRTSESRSISSGLDSAASSSSRTDSAVNEIDEETSSLLNFKDETSKEEEKAASFIRGICSKLGISPRGIGKKGTFNSIPNDADTRTKKMQRQFTIP